MTEQLALDRSERFKDQDGHLHVKRTNLSKACVNPYRGSEIPGHEALGLDPDKIYQLFRDPKELEKAAPTFNNLRLMSRHVAVSATDPKEHLVAGSTGSEARFEHPYLINSLVIWRDDDIKDVESQEKCQISAGYYYKPDMTAGTHEGQPYDGVMREIKANHVALVEAGRAGPDVQVHDSGEKVMALVSKKSLMVRHTMATLLRGNVVPGTTLALDQELSLVTRENWPVMKPVVMTAIETRLKPSLKSGVSFDAIRLAMDEADKEDEESDAEDDEVESMDAAEEAEEAEAREREEKEGMKTEDRKKAAKDRKTTRDAKRAKDAKMAYGSAKAVKDKKPAKDRKALDKTLGRKATDKEFEEWAKEEEEEPEHADDKRPARDARRARDEETPEEKEKRERDKKAEDKKAMDEMSASLRKTILADVTSQMNAATQAREDVRPHVGGVSLAFDTADAIYAYALKAKKVSIDGVHPSAYRAMVGMIPKPGRNERPVPLALDHSAAGLSFEDQFPMAAHIRL